MIYDGVNLETKYPELIVELDRKTKKPTERSIDITHVPGKSGDIVADGGSFSDVELEYSMYVRVRSEYDRTHTTSMLLGDLIKPEKCELEDKRDNGRILNAILTGYSHKRAGIEPTLYEHYTLTFQCDPYATSKVLYEKQISSTDKTVLNNGHTQANFVLEGTTTSSTTRLVVSIPGHGELVINYAFSPGMKFMIDSERHYVEINTQNAMKYISLTSDFFDLPKGKAEFNCVGWRGTVKYKEKYLVG